MILFLLTSSKIPDKKKCLILLRLRLTPLNSPPIFVGDWVFSNDDVSLLMSRLVDNASA